MPSRDDLLNMDGMMFPEKGGTSIFIPSAFILHEIESKSMYASIWLCVVCM